MSLLSLFWNDTYLIWRLIHHIERRNSQNKYIIYTTQTKHRPYLCDNIILRHLFKMVNPLRMLIGSHTHFEPLRQMHLYMVHVIWMFNIVMELSDWSIYVYHFRIRNVEFCIAQKQTQTCINNQSKRTSQNYFFFSETKITENNKSY